MSWPRQIARALARLVVVAVVVAVLLWLLVEAAPGSTAERAAQAAGVLPADDTALTGAHRVRLIESVSSELGLDGGFAARMARHVGGLATLDFGRSWGDGTSVRGRLLDAAPATLLLVFLALLIGIMVGLGVAVVSAQREGGAFDAAMAALSATAFALPPVWLAILLARTFAAGHPWRWFPVEGLSGSGVVLPLFAMSIVPAFVLARHARAALLEACRAPWATATRARGVSQQRIVAVHALRASGSVLLPLVVVFVAYLFGASVVVERVFGIRGLGALLLDASARGDAPLIVGVGVVTAMIIALTSSAVDIVRSLVDPRELA